MNEELDMQLDIEVIKARLTHRWGYVLEGEKRGWAVQDFERESWKKEFDRFSPTDMAALLVAYENQQAEIKRLREINSKLQSSTDNQPLERLKPNVYLD